ncbi:SURF1 family protein [Caenimonas terrae]|uniref:SURF1-like protein n=1 Tax=Caenimonas terrae TaxID=696074 RepID=A0ABW0N6X4_9BURK
MTPQPPGRFWRVAIAAVLGIAAGLALGGWQLSRAAQKNAMHAAMEQHRNLPALDGRELAGAADPQAVVWRPVRLQGRWLPEHTVYLDNRQMQAKPGFDVLTPLRIDGTDKVVVVQRGWVQRNFLDRTRLPAIETPAGVVEVSGLIAPPPPKLYAFSTAESGPIRQNLDLGELRARTGLPLLTTLSVQQVGPASGGLLREWTPPGSGVEKHYGYAFQWFALSALIAVLYVWFQFIAPRRKAPHA